MSVTAVRAVCGVDGLFEDMKRFGLDRSRADAEQNEYLVRSYLNRGVNTDALPRRLWVDDGPRSDSVRMRDTRGFLISHRLRELFDDVAPGCFDYQPVLIDEDVFWLARVDLVLDALDLAAGDVERDGSGYVMHMNRPVWRGDVLTRPAIFKIPQAPWRTYVTDQVAASYWHSGYSGLTLHGPLGEVR